MFESIFPLGVYFALILTAVLLPYAIPQEQQKMQPNARLAEKSNHVRTLTLVTGIALILTLMRGGLLVPGAILLVLSALGYGWRALLGAFSASMLLAASLWWLPDQEFGANRQIIAAAICGIVAVIARACRFEPSGDSLSFRYERLIFGLLFVAGLLTGLLTGAVNADSTAWTTWHHWGAYLSPVMPLLAGGTPFQDFPVQYGMGPTLLLASACSIRDCWYGLYAVTIGANALYLATCGWACLVLTRNLDWQSRLLVLTALAAALWLWAGYPVDWSNPVITPSTGGLRFLPLATLLALILAIERRTQAGVSPKLALIAGYAAWVVGLIWSPESAFFATLLWWPWLALRKADELVDQRAKLNALVQTAARATAALIAGYGCLALLFRMYFGAWVSLQDFLLYIAYPPGRLPINPFGAIWLAAITILFALLAMIHCADRAARRTLCAVLLTTLAAGSYYLSRSHDNNVLNLLPFLMLLLLAAYAAWPGQFMSGFLRAAMVGLIALTTTFLYHAWTVLPAGSSIAGLQIGPGALISRFDPGRKNVPAVVHPHAVQAFADLRRGGNDAVMLFDDKKIMPSFKPEASWTGVNNPANFLPLPAEIISKYIARGSAKFRRPGWLVMTQIDIPLWLPVFEQSYTVAEKRQYGTYTAYRMVPRDVR
jgi:hypothetical protein